jgi:hypothetical protein
VSGHKPEGVLTERAPSEMLADSADRKDDGIGWALIDPERQGRAVEPDDGGVSVVARARSLRRATARRASKRRATARRRQGDIEATIIGFLAKHPGSTVGDLAKGLNLDPGSAAAHLTQLAKTGEIKKVSHGYRTSAAVG